MTNRERQLVHAENNEQVVGDHIQHVVAGGAWEIDVRTADGRKYSISLEVLKSLLGHFVFENYGGRLADPRVVDADDQEEIPE